MNQCDVCKNETLPDIDNPICQICGYAPKEKAIKDKDSCKSTMKVSKTIKITGLKPSSFWEESRSLQNIQELQLED